MRETQSKSIEKKTAEGIFWRYMEEISTKAVSFVVSVILARILIPDDYALVSVAVILIGFANTVVDGGLSTAIIQKGNADSTDYSTALIFSLTVSLFAYGIIYFLAPLFGLLYHLEEAVAVIRVLSILIIVQSVKSVFYARICSQLQFRKLFFSSLSGTAISAVVGIVLAQKGCGAWALVAQQFTDAIIDTVIMGISARVSIQPRFSPERFKILFRYSKNVLIARLTAQITNTITPVLISLRFTVLDLTYYTKAKGLSSLMLSFVEGPLSQVLFPALSQIKDDREKLLGVLRRFYRILYFFTLPALFGLYAVAEDLVVFLLTEKWISLVPYIRIFVFAMVFNKNIQGIKAIGRSDLYMKSIVGCRFFGMICLILALIISENPMGIAWSLLPMYAAYFFVQMYWEHKYLQYKIIDQVSDMVPSLIAALLMGLCVYGASRFPGIEALSVGCRLAVRIIVGVVAYFAVSMVLNRKTIETMAAHSRDFSRVRLH